MPAPPNPPWAGQHVQDSFIVLCQNANKPDVAAALGIMNEGFDMIDQGNNKIAEAGDSLQKLADGFLDRQPHGLDIPYSPGAAIAAVPRRAAAIPECLVCQEAIPFGEGHHCPHCRERFCEACVDLGFRCKQPWDHIWDHDLDPMGDPEPTDCHECSRPTGDPISYHVSTWHRGQCQVFDVCEACLPQFKFKLTDWADANVELVVRDGPRITERTDVLRQKEGQGRKTVTDLRDGRTIPLLSRAELAFLGPEGESSSEEDGGRSRLSRVMAGEIK